MIKENVDQYLKTELINILKEPVYIECCLPKIPLVPMRQNHKTQILFISLFLLILLGQWILILPSKFLFAFKLRFCRPKV